WAEMGNPFFRVVKHFYRYIFYRHAFPGGPHHDLNLELELGCIELLRNFVQRIKPVAGLRVLQCNSGFKPKPEGRDSVAYTAFLRNAGLLHITVAYKQNIDAFIFQCLKLKASMFCL